MPCSSKKTCARYLSEQRAIVSTPGTSTTAPPRLVARLGEHEVVEVGQRDDQPHVVQLDEVAERADVAEVVDARHERAVVGVVERRRELVDVGRDRRRAGLAERGDDVDALPGAREEDGRHDLGG